MHVALNLLELPSTAQGGAGLYAATLIEGLAARPGVRVSVLGEPRVAEEIHQLGTDVHVVEVVREALGPVRRLGNAVGSLEDVARFRPFDAAARALEDVDVVHYPLGFVPGPRHSAVRIITAVDVQHLAFPRYFSRRDRLLRALRWHRSWRAADRLVAFSAFVKRELITRLRLNGEHIDVVPIAPHSSFFLAGDVSVRGRPFAVFPASPLPHKNHAVLMRVFADPRLSEIDLVLTGPTGHDWTAVRSEIARHGLSERVRFAGHVSREQLRSLYAGAVCLAFPSRYEGFGMPVAEAMAAGCPVVAARAASLPEIVETAGILVEPDDVDGFAAAILRLRRLPAERERLVAAGRQRAQDFTTERMVRATLAAYHAALRRPRR